MTYPSPSSVNASQGLGGIFTYINTVTNSWVSNMLLLAVYIIILIGFYKAKDDIQGAFAVAGYGVFVVGLLFWLGGFVSGWAFSIAIALAIIGTFALLMDNGN